MQSSIPFHHVITFAGIPGCGKSPVASFLSWNYGLPILSNDVIRFEVREDRGSFDAAEYKLRRDTRVDALLNSGRSFIYDASVDRSWSQLAPRLHTHEYAPLIISFDLTRPFVEELYRAKEYDPINLDKVLSEHDAFKRQFSSLVSLVIRDDTYKDRLALASGTIESALGID